MSELGLAVPASLDEVLTAVKETARGRWFLESFEARLRGSETARVLEAINKLENHVQSIAKGGTDAELVRRAREAISAARKDIAATEPSVANLSAEAKLFAQLAEKARGAFNDNPATNQSVVRALQLVGDLDRTFSTLEPAAKSPEPAQFFKQDEAIFEPAPKRAPTLAVPTEGHVEANPRGAKLVVHRMTAVESPKLETPQAGVPATQPEPIVSAPASLAAEVMQDAIEPPKSRIVIVRRKSDEMEDVPMMEPSEASSQSSASAA